MNKLVLSMAYKSLSFKLAKARELKLDSISDQEFLDLAKDLAQAKLDAGSDKTLQELVKGQEWYLNHLKSLLAMSPKEALDAEYARAVADFGEEQDMLEQLEKLYS